MKYSCAALFIAALLATASCTGPSEATGKPADSIAKSSPPAAALVVDSKQNMGCLVSQKLVEDAIKKLAEGISLRPGEGAEDTSNDHELYLIFDAKSQPGFSGFLVYRLWVEAKEGPEKDSVTITDPKVVWKESGWSLEMSASGTGVLRILPMWSHSKELAPIWRTCPEAGVLEPFQASFLVAQAVETPLQPSDRFDLVKEPQKIQAGFEKASFAQLSTVDKCFDALDSMQKAFSTAESPLLWSEAKLTKKAIDDAIPGEVRGRGVIEVAIKPDRQPPIANGNPNPAAHLKVRIALLDKAGKRKGAEISLGYLPGGPGGRGAR